MEITINGKREQVAPCSIAELVAMRELDGTSLVVEHNQRIVSQDKWSEVMLRESDTLELLNFVGGG